MKKEMWRVVPAESGHIDPVAREMRETDRREVWASHRHTPYEALAASLAASDLAWTCLVAGRPAFMWGAARCGSLMSRTGSPWLLATDAIGGVRRDFARFSRRYVALMLERFERLENWTHAENTRSRRWLAWLGFNIEPNISFIHGEPFHLFWRDAHV